MFDTSSLRLRVRTLWKSSVVATLVGTACFQSLVAVNAEELAPNAGQNSSVAILQDGRVVEGSMTEVPGGYMIQHKNGGQSVIPFDQISVTALSLDTAYQSFKGQVETPNADAHLQLAQWCLVNGLWSQAYTEAEAALKLEPNRKEAREMVQRLEQIIQIQRVSGSGKNQLQSLGTRAVTPAVSETSVQRAETGVPINLNRAFAGQIQPILMNSCANGACHGQISSNEFKLQNVRFSSRNLRLASDANLKTLIDWIDVERPERSPLLMKPSENTKHHRGLFAGQRQTQYELLEAWVIEVAAQQRAGQLHTTPPRPTGMIGGDLAGVGAEQRSAPGKYTKIEPINMELGKGKPRMTPIAPQELSPIPAMLPMISGAAPMTGVPQLNPETTPLNPAVPPKGVVTQPAVPVEQVRKNSRPDAFDPEAFNRMIQSGTGQ